MKNYEYIPIVLVVVYLLACKVMKLTRRLISPRLINKQITVLTNRNEYAVIHRETTMNSSIIEFTTTLTPSEEDAIVRYIIELDTRGFSPRRADVEDMANLLLAKCGARRVGKNWTDRFIKRRPELCTRFSRAYDYQRAFQEDPDVLNAWFRLVANMRAKYGIQDCDFYNFDETGFMMGIIRPGMVVTRSDRVSKPSRSWTVCNGCQPPPAQPPWVANRKPR